MRVITKSSLNWFARFGAYMQIKIRENTHGGILLLVKLQTLLTVLTLLTVTLFYGCFSRFLSCTNGTK